MDILVIGCGVSGLTTGLCLLEAGYSTHIWARELPPHTTSNAAAAVWFPFKAYPLDKVTVWGRESWQKFQELQPLKESGVVMRTFIEVLPTPAPDPWWVSAVPDFRHADQAELPTGYLDGYSCTTPVIDTGVYLDYLVREFTARNGQIVQRAVTHLAEAFAHAPIVVNCSGLGARELVGDTDIRPAKGQVVRIRPNGFQRVLVDETGQAGLTYIVPRLHDIVLGGTYEEGNERADIDPEVRQAILQRCARLAPEFRSVTAADIISEGCGFRPVRSAVRVEAERLSTDRLLLHNYGHGGAGITLSWGCAREVVELLATTSR
ncbi:MAG: FAD-dependent oxidoreductase [Ktedonobacteraceae bacterium]